MGDRAGRARTRYSVGSRTIHAGLPSTGDIETYTHTKFMANLQR